MVNLDLQSQLVIFWIFLGSNQDSVFLAGGVPAVANQHKGVAVWYMDIRRKVGYVLQCWLLPTNCSSEDSHYTCSRFPCLNLSQEVVLMFVVGTLLLHWLKLWLVLQHDCKVIWEQLPSSYRNVRKIFIRYYICWYHTDIVKFHETSCPTIKWIFCGVCNPYK